MVDIAALFFWALGLSSYPTVYFLSLKKSASFASKRGAAISRVLFCLVAIYLETLLLSSLVAYFFPYGWPPYVAFFITLLAIILTASYTLKAAFGLSFRRGILAYTLWQCLSLLLGALLVVTLLAAMVKTLLTFLLIIALMLLSWWRWRAEP
ncbi:MAG: hypothetical protein JTT11_09275, partial [Candidatus Brockarchaeota archaeon]|nr:hypothetical protein [Candidatus Brockarchaeota archaeon]